MAEFADAKTTLTTAATNLPSLTTSATSSVTEVCIETSYSAPKTDDNYVDKKAEAYAETDEDEWLSDPANPRNWSARSKWTMIVIVSSPLSLLTRLIVDRYHFTRSYRHLRAR